MSFQSLSELVKNYESGGDYTAKNPSSSASGAYQFTTSTWQSYAGPQISSQYPTAADAPAAIQDSVFATAVAKNGLNDWTCPGCNPGLVAHLASNPGDANLPLFGGGQLQTGNQASPYIDVGGNPITGPSYYTGTDANGLPAASTNPSDLTNPQPVYAGNTNAQGGGTGSNLGAGQPGYLPPSATGGPAALGITPGLASGIGGWINGIESAVGSWATNAAKSAFATLENWVGRAGLILLAIVIIALALWRLMDPTGEKTQAVIKTAAVAA